MKCSGFLEYAHIFNNVVIIIGVFTAYISGTIGMTQFDIKKVIAYSTCSQLGYMFIACGASNYLGGFYHLINHAFFKALLFLCAGAIIHSCYNEQDIRKLGGLAKILPYVYTLMFLGNLALSGFTFLTGFFSKDFIIDQLLFYGNSYTFYII
jgi:NADH:ubiquinone oxidoreductase subunit 5 (subunit L)/multisubunit Na+/H+ antiporter MnhA subunit